MSNQPEPNIPPPPPPLRQAPRRSTSTPPLGQPPPHAPHAQPTAAPKPQPDPDLARSGKPAAAARACGVWVGVLATLGLCIGTPLLLLLTGLTTGGGFIGQALESMANTLTGALNPGASAVVQMTIDEDEVRLLSRLTTFEANFSSEAVCADVQWGAFGANNFSACYRMLFSVQSGVDLSREELAVEQRDANRYRITLPPVELTACSLRVLDSFNYSATLVSNAYWDDNRRMAEYQAMLRFVEAGQRREYIQQAEQTAAAELQRFLEQFVDGVAVSVQFAEGAVRIDQTCEPTVPDAWDFSTGWQYDADSATWTTR